MSMIFDTPHFSFASIGLVILLCVLLHRLLLKRGEIQHQTLPPSPWFWLPVLGHLHLLDANISKPCARLRKQLGDVFRVKLGSRDCIVLCGYDVIKDALIKHGDYFTNRATFHLMDRMSRGSGIILANDEKWKEQRRFIFHTLKEFGMGKSFLEKTIHEEIEHLIRAIDDEGGKEFDPKHYISTSVVNIISTMVFGSTFKHGDPKLKALSLAVEENLHNGYFVGIVIFLPFLLWLPGDLFNMKKVFQNSDDLYAFVEEIIQEHQAEFDENSINDFISAYTKRLRETDESGESTSFSRQELAGNVVDLFIAGMETTATALLWIIPFLALYPDKQRRMFNEIEKYVGLNRLPSQQDRANLAYVEAFYTETLRYVNLATSGSIRAMTRDLEFRGYHLPAGTMVLVDFGSVLSDPEIWQDPQNFRPERFLDDLGAMKNHGAFIAFSLGKRNCVGEPLARMELLLFLSALVQRYEIAWPDGKQLSETELDGDYRAIHKPSPYEIVFKKRSV